MAKNKVFMLNRKQYDRVRKMDHCQMSMWAESIYKSGFKDGKDAESGNALTVEQVREVLLNVKGLGAKRVDAACEELKAALEQNAIDRQQV